MINCLAWWCHWLAVCRYVEKTTTHDMLVTAYVKTISVSLSLSPATQTFPVCFLSQISDSEMLHWKELVAKCMTEYCSSECNKPDNKKLVWIVSRRTAQSLQANHFSVPGLPTIPEGSWDESERLIVQFHFLPDTFFSD